MLQTHLQIFNYSVANKSDGVIDVHIDGDIVDASTQEIMKNWWGDETSTSYKSFRNQVDSANPSTLNIYVNSTGGHVGDAMAIHDYLSELESKGVTVNRKGRGIVASAATYIVMGNNSELSQNSFMMIHNVIMSAYGDINSVENQVKAGRKFNDTIRDFYANQTGNPPETISKWMNAETWMNSQEAKDRGFVKNITGSVEITNSISEDKFPYNNKAILNQYNSQIKTLDMNIKEAITNAVNSAFEKMGFKDKATAPEVVNLINDLTTSFEAANKGLDGDAVNALIATAITNAKIPDVTNFATKEDVTTVVNTAVGELVKKTDIANFASKEDVTKVKNEIILAIAENAGSSTNGGEEETKVIKINSLRSKSNNKYAGIKYADVTTK